jgi:hypothetical protein
MDRYREAGYAAVKQVDWCIQYLRSIHKRQLAAQLEKNRTVIARRLR